MASPTTTSGAVRVTLVDDLTLSKQPTMLELYATHQVPSTSAASFVVGECLLPALVGGSIQAGNPLIPLASDWHMICATLFDAVEQSHAADLHRDSGQYRTLRALLPVATSVATASAGSASVAPADYVTARTLSKALTLCLPEAVWHTHWPKCDENDVLDRQLASQLRVHASESRPCDSAMLNTCQQALKHAILV